MINLFNLYCCETHGNNFLIGLWYCFTRNLLAVNLLNNWNRYRIDWCVLRLNLWTIYWTYFSGNHIIRYGYVSSSFKGRLTCTLTSILSIPACVVSVLHSDNTANFHSPISIVYLLLVLMFEWIDHLLNV